MEAHAPAGGGVADGSTSAMQPKPDMRLGKLGRAITSVCQRWNTPEDSETAEEDDSAVNPSQCQ